MFFKSIKRKHMTLNKLILITALGGLVSPVAMAKTAAEYAELAAKHAAAAAESAAAAQQAADDAKAAAAAESTAATTTASVTTDGPQYKVVDGQVDKPTFNGYRRFHGTCHACHGQDAAGGSFAPSLVESLKTMDYATFTKTVLEGRQSASSGGGTSAMPAFANDPNVTKHLDDIYMYVKARSDGALGTGRPKKLPKK